MKKKIEFYLGDRVKTKKKFKPLDENDKEVELEKPLTGTIVDKRATFLLVDFGEELGYTNYLDGLLAAPTGYAISGDDLELIDEFTDSDATKVAFVRNIREIGYKMAAQIPKDIVQSENLMRQTKQSIDNVFRDIKSLEKDLAKENRNFSKLKERQKDLPYTVDKTVNQFEKLLRHDKVKSIEIIEYSPDKKSLLITTEDLTFKDEYKDLPTFNLGAFKIQIPLDGGNRDSIKVANYKKHLQSGEYHHPCVHSNFGLCLGGSVSRQIDAFMFSKSFVQLVHMLISFLEEPDYGTPYVSAIIFSCAQDVTIRPRDQRKWFERSYWSQNQPWDADKYKEDLKEANSKNTGDRLPGAPIPGDEPTCPECGEYWNEEVCTECGFEN